jgi:hypothetical protein
MQGFLTSCKILQHGAEGFTSPLMEDILQFLSSSSSIALGWVISQLTHK